jgi:hypothetical protein
MFDLVPLSLENYFYNFVVHQCSLCSFFFVPVMLIFCSLLYDCVFPYIGRFVPSYF